MFISENGNDEKTCGSDGCIQKELIYSFNQCFGCLQIHYDDMLEGVGPGKSRNLFPSY
jgi:hypothetical protein